MQDLPEYSLPEAAMLLTQMLGKPCLVEHLESLIKFEKILACISTGWRYVYLPSEAYGAIKKGQHAMGAEYLEKLYEGDLLYFNVGILHIEDVVILREELYRYAADQRELSTHEPVQQSSSPPPMQRQRAQELALLAAMRDAGYNPESIPNAPRTPEGGVKRIMRDKLVTPSGFTKSVFLKTWQRLRNQGAIGDSK